MGLVRITSWYPHFNGSHLACHPARSTEWLDCHPKSCERWRIRSGPFGKAFSSIQFYFSWRRQIRKSMKRWQSYSCPSFRSQPILSDYFASQMTMKNCPTRVLTTLYYMRSYTADWPVQRLSVAIANSRRQAAGARSSIHQKVSTNPLLPNTKTRTAYNSTAWREDGGKRNFRGPKRQLFLQNKGFFKASTWSLVIQLHARE